MSEESIGICEARTGLIGGASCDVACEYYVIIWMRSDSVFQIQYFNDLSLSSLSFNHTHPSLEARSQDSVGLGVSIH